VDQHHWLAGAVIFVVDLDVGGILPADGDLGHELSFLGWAWLRHGKAPGGAALIQWSGLQFWAGERPRAAWG